MYLVVQFTNEKEIALIPSTWLDGDSCAKWPPYKNPDKINKAVKDKLLPESNWKSYPIEGLFGNSSYEKSWKWLKEETERNEMKPIQSQEPDLDMHVVKIEHGSDLALQPDTSDTIAFDPRQRQPSTTNVEYDCKEDTGFCMKQEDCSEEESDTFYQTQKRGKLTPSGTSDVLKSSPSPAEEEVKKKNGSFPSFSHITFDSSQQSTSTITPCVHSSIFPSTSWTTSSSISSNEDGMQSRFLFLLEELLDEVKVMRSEVKKALKVMEYIRNNTSGTMDQVKLPEGYEFPLASVKEAERLDADLKADAEKRRHLEHYLAMLGGFNLRSALKAILSALFSTQLARQYNYNGLKGKKGLKSLNSIMQIIYTAVRKHFQDATEADIRVHLSKWLSTARDRDYGRRERNNKRHRVEKAINERGSAQESSQ